ncbi:MAG: SDR family NAD(P)-dependent oxidoreductase [Chloroflexi bacterium]|nr:SDR family NAD(P)-dependent oxidoreductase [Chloroflexota bacterium]
MTADFRLSSASLVVASGGARGITGACVVALARRYSCRFVLLGRSEARPEPAWALGCNSEAELKQRISSQPRSDGAKPTPLSIQREFEAIHAAREIAATLAQVRAAGSQVEYIRVDITDAAELQAAMADVRARLGPVSVLLHGAGALADKPIERKTERDFDLVYSTKLGGLENLLACLPASDLRLLVLFSSAAGFFGNPGQADYALSNEILNRVAARLAKAAPRMRTMAINWGPWEAGMVSPELKRLFADRGIDVIPLASGTDTLIRAIEAAEPPVIGLAGRALAQAPATPAVAGRVRRTERRLDESANPFLADHVIGGHAVLPAMCGVSWLANTAEQLYPGWRFFGLRDFQVLKGIVFDETLAGSYTLECAAREADERALQLDMLVRGGGDAERPRYHYRAAVTLLPDVPSPQRLMEFSLAENEHARAGTAFYEEGTLFHGPAFRGVDRLLNASEVGLTMRCQLPQVSEAAQGQFPVQSFNPFTADVCFQALVIWSRLFRSAASLPLAADLGEQFRPLPFDTRFYVTLKVHSATDSRLVAETVAHDEQGVIYARVAGASVTLSQALNPLFVRSSN